MNRHPSPITPRTIFWIILVLILIFVPRLLFPFLFFYFIYLIVSGIFSLPEIRDKYDLLSKLKNIFQKNIPRTVETEQSSQFPNYFTSMEPMQFKKSYIVYAVIILSVLFVIIDGLVSVPAGHVAVIYDRGRGVLEKPYPEGLHLKIPFWQVATIMDTRLQSYTMSVAPDEGEQYGDDSIESLTKDGQKIFVDITVQYRINNSDTPWVFQNIGTDYLVKIVRPGVRNIIRDVITGYDSTQLFTRETREEAQKKMRDGLKEQYAVNKVELIDLLLRNIKFSEVYLQSIEDKQVAQQRIQKAEYEKQESEKLKEKKIIEAEAEAEAIRLKGETLKANPQVIQFEFVQKISPGIKWGILPNSIMPLLDLKSMME
jgi:regulator of protease activity HflC (stomatin/prohibitin superfamily)